MELADDGKNICIFDVDDATLSNLPYYEVHHYGAEAVNSTALNEWFMVGKLPALNETLEFYNNLLKLEKIKLIILTGRRDDMEDVVKANLQEAGYGNWTKLILKETSYSGSTFEFKEEERRKLVEEDGYRIIGNMGDQWSDIQGIHLGNWTFKLSNPLYYTAGAQGTDQNLYFDF
ncbi:acid phosphatase 1-like [Pistacia vera]|uniref:acid phosphatase 1-like n=1 Tax=Pistacia vera TaxID=55513 RepID=UPI0012635990|nr:acid phosphatase 1-like [Pistacia vera]